MSAHAGTTTTCVIAGAGLVGPGARAGARARRALASRSSIARRSRRRRLDADDDWDTRVYAISPGSAAFLRALGAWQALPAERIAPIEAMRVEGDAGATLDFSAYELGERALAWIVEERALRAALVAARARGRRRRASRRRAFDGAGVGAPTPATLRFADGDAIARAAGRRRRRRALVGARGGGHRRRAASPTAQTAVVANFALRARASRPRAANGSAPTAACSRGCRCPGGAMSIVWSAPDALAQRACWRSPPEALAARVAEAGDHALGALDADHAGGGVSAAVPASCRRPSRIGSRWSATRRTACIRWPGRASTSVSAMRRRSRRCWPSAARSTDAGAPLLLERYARRRAEPVLAMQAVTDGLARLFGAAARRGCAALRNAGMAAVDRLPCLKRAAGATCAALDCPNCDPLHGDPDDVTDRRRSCAAALAPRRSPLGAALALPARSRQTPPRAPPPHARSRRGQEAPRAEVSRRRGRQHHQEPVLRPLRGACSTTGSIYTDAKVNYVIVGSIYDTATKKNLTEARLRELNRVAFDSLPLDLAFKRVKGNGARKLAMFSDADCPFCARLEKEMKGIDNVTIYTFLFPIDQLHPGLRAQVEA